MSKLEQKKKIDWESIEKDWRAGIKSALQIATEHEISHTAINKRFKKLGVPRDLKAKIKAKTDALVSAAAVSAAVSTETKPCDTEIIDANAHLQANTLISHRKDIKRGRSLMMNLMAELESETADPELFGQLAEIMLVADADATKPEVDRMAKMQQIFDRIMSSPGRIDALKKLSDTMKNLIALERQALGLSADDLPNQNDPIGRIERVFIVNGKNS